MPRLRRLLSTGLTLAVTTALLAGCTSDDDDTTASEEGSAAALGLAPLPYEYSLDWHSILVWDQPQSGGWFGQYGYCGPTAVANLLRWYGIEKSPQTAIDQGCWSYVGTSPGTLSRYLQREHGDLGCKFGTIPDDMDPLAALRALLAAGQPPIVLINYGGTTLHWMVLTGIQGSGDAPQVEFMSWGSYLRTPWKELDARWRRALGLHHPLIACSKKSPQAPLRVE